MPEARGPREVFERFRRNVVAGLGGLTGDMCAEDVVVEQPFAPVAAARRVAGRAEFTAFAQATRAALPVAFERCDALAVHDTRDPGTIVVEYEMAGTVTTTGTCASATFVLVLTVRDGLVVRWREYQDTAAVARALGAGAS